MGKFSAKIEIDLTIFSLVPRETNTQEIMLSSNPQRNALQTAMGMPAPGSDEVVGITPTENIRRASLEARYGLRLRKPSKGILKSPKAHSEPQRLGGAGELLTRRQRRKSVSFGSSTSNRWESQASSLNVLNARPRRRPSAGEQGASRVNHVWEPVTSCPLVHSSKSFSSNARLPRRKTSIIEDLMTENDDIFKAAAASFLLEAGAMPSPMISTQNSSRGRAA